MKEENINEIMEKITQDSSLCVIREALENYNPEKINELMKESEEELLILGVCFRDVIKNKHELIDEDSDSANFSAGRISVLKELLICQ